MNEVEPKSLNHESIVELKTELQTLAARLASDYRPRVLPQHPYKGTEVPPPDIVHSEKVYAQKIQTSMPGFTFTVFEIGGVSSMITRSTKQWALWAKLEKGDELASEGFLLHNNQDRWNFSHRLTPKDFRGLGLFDCVRGFLETFVQARAQETKKAQLIFLSAGQPDVIRQFSKRGYTPSDTDNLTRLKRIQRPNNGLVLKPAFKPKVFSGGQEYEPTEEAYSSLYYFDHASLANIEEPGKYTIENAFRVELQKNFFPTTK